MIVSLRRLLIQRACLIYRTRLSTTWANDRCPAIDVQIAINTHTHTHTHTHAHRIAVQLISSRFFCFFFLSFFLSFFRSLRYLFTYTRVCFAISDRDEKLEFCPWEFSGERNWNVTLTDAGSTLSPVSYVTTHTGFVSSGWTINSRMYDWYVVA